MNYNGILPNLPKELRLFIAVFVIVLSVDILLAYFL